MIYIVGVNVVTSKMYKEKNTKTTSGQIGKEAMSADLPGIEKNSQ